MPFPASEVLAALAQKRQRLTRARRGVVEALCAVDRPLTVRELHESLRQVDLVTVYRTLGWLVQLGVAREVAALPGAERFEMIDRGAHAHHLHCDGCGRVVTAPVCGVDEAVFALILREYGFAVTDHALTFRGRCAQCERRAA
jgi:Fur family ferric uptake transcriptional regulator